MTLAVSKHTHTRMHPTPLAHAYPAQVRVPFLEVMTSLAVGEYGTALVLRQFTEMGRSPALEVLTWRKLFATVVEYCVRYNTVLAEVGCAAWGGSADVCCERAGGVCCMAQAHCHCRGVFCVRYNTVLAEVGCAALGGCVGVCGECIGAYWWV